MSLSFEDYVPEYSLPEDESLTTPPTNLDSTMPPPPEVPKRKNRSDVWTHYDVEGSESDKRARCKYCHNFIKFKDGTSAMRTHLSRCKRYPDNERNKRPRTSSSSTEVLPFLKIFYDATMRISGSSYVTSNSYMKEVFTIGRNIRRKCEDEDESIRSMAIKMKNKYDKYWLDPSQVNILLLIAVVLDPRCKMSYVEAFLKYLFEPHDSSALILKLTSSLKSIYEEYQGLDVEVNSQPEAVRPDDDDDIHGMGFVQQATGRRSIARSEVEKYLAEDCEPHNKLVELDILNWWKVNSSRFPILANIAREVLAIPVSTVASESAFSTGGRVLGPHRSNLTPKIVEGLICTQDWLKGTPFSTLFEEDLEEHEKFEQELLISSIKGASSSAINLDE